MARALEIAVVGAGISGLASAIVLSRAGHRITVYERFDAAKPLGSGLMIQPTGLAALERLGLREALEGLGHRIYRLHGKTAGGRTIFDLDYRTLDPALHAVAVHRAALHGVLWSGFARSGARLETSCAIAGVDAAPDGAFRLIAEGGRPLPVADLIIDASGARSVLRHAVAGREPTPFSYGAVWATVADTDLAPQTLEQRYVDARIMIGHLPLGRVTPGDKPLAAFFWSLKPRDYDAWRGGFDRWRRQVESLWPALAPIVAAMRGPDDFAPASYAHFTGRRLSRANVILVGDAAHMTSPQLGQGANQGMIDAIVLADALSLRRDPSKAADLYVRLRRRHVRFYQYASALMTPFFQSDSRLLAGLRDLAFNPLKRIPYLHREMIRTLAGLKTGLFTAGTPDSIVNCVPDWRMAALRQPALEPAGEERR